MLKPILKICMLFFITTSIQAQVVIASTYGNESGNITANGEKFHPNQLTAAHKTLKFGTKLKVTYKGKSVVVRINDRGPYIRGRSLDLSTGSAKKIGFSGVGKVKIEKLN